MAPTSVHRMADPSPPFEPAGPLPELQALGGRLREAREAQGLSRSHLADRLKIGTEQLEALEAGNREPLREAVYVIALARRIAGCLGVNIDPEIEALRANAAFQSSRPAVAARPLPSNLQPAADPIAGGATRRRRPGALARVATVVVVAGVGASTLALQLGRLQLDPAQLPPLPRLPSLPRWPEFARPSAPPAPRPAATAPAAVPAQSQAPTAAPDTLVLTTEGRSWIEVTTADGRRLFRGTLEGRQVFPLGQGLRVLAGRPDLVRAQLGEGPVQVLGPIDQVQWRRFPAAVRAPAP
jgi:cytoskeleton protein RodZ